MGVGQRRPHRLVIEGTLPGLNEYSAAERGRWGAQTAARLKRETQERIGWAIAAQMRGVRFTEPVRLRYLWVEPNRRRDKDNICFAHKFVQDALVEAGVLRGDGWRHIWEFSDAFAVDRSRPRVEVEIEEVEDGRGGVFESANID